MTLFGQDTGFYHRTRLLVTLLERICIFGQYSLTVDRSTSDWHEVSPVLVSQFGGRCCQVMLVVGRARFASGRVSFILSASLGRSILAFYRGLVDRC
jgi:hypothetical protein